MNIILAPGTYSPEKSNLSSSPRYSFGIKHSSHQSNEFPGERRTILYNFLNIIIALNH